MKLTKTVSKPKKQKKTLEELEKESKSEIDGIRQDATRKINEEYLNAHFYFSVVFSCKQDRDEWLKKEGLKLKDESYILAKDYDISIRRKSCEDFQEGL
jgi:hypothetical protein